MKRGRLNLHDKAGGSMASVLADLETIWSAVIYSQLQIPTKDLKVGSMGCLYLKVGSMGCLYLKVGSMLWVPRVLVPQGGQYACAQGACTSRWAVCLCPGCLYLMLGSVLVPHGGQYDYLKVGSMLVPQGGHYVCTSRWAV